MKNPVVTGLACLALAISTPLFAEEVKIVDFGDAAVIYDYLPAGEGAATLSLNAVVSETNDSLRGLKNSDRRRLGKLGQLIYQCKLLLYRSAQGGSGGISDAPVLVSKNYSLFTGVEQSLANDERLGVKVLSLQSFDETSLFNATLDKAQASREAWQVQGEGSEVDLRQINVNLLNDSGIVDNAENIDIVLRFPIFQLQQSARQWSYNFDLRDFRKAVAYADQQCTPENLAQLLKPKG